jgi:hypothetical protein
VCALLRTTSWPGVADEFERGDGGVLNAGIRSSPSRSPELAPL